MYGALLPGERARLHTGYATALADMPAGRSAAAPQFAAQLAEHWYRARQPADALAWSAQAATGAERVYAHGEAGRLWEQVLELWDLVPDAADRAGADRARLHTRAARAWEYAGDEGRALRQVEQALRQVDSVADGVRAGLLHNLRGWYCAGTTNLDVVLAAHREAVQLIAAQPPSAARAQVLLGYGRALHIQAGWYQEAAAVDEQARSAARQAGSRPDLARATAAVGYLRAATGEVDVGTALLDEARALTERFADEAAPADPEELLGRDWEWRLATEVRLFLSDVRLKANRLEEAAQVAVQGWETLRRLGLADHRTACVLLGYAVEALFGLGRWDEAARLSEPAADQPVTRASSILHGKLAELDGARGQLAAALARLDEVRARGWRLGPEQERELGERRAEVQLWLGHPQPALSDVMRALDAVTGTDQERFAGWLCCLGARALADLAERAWARRRQRPGLTSVAGCWPGG